MTTASASLLSSSRPAPAFAIFLSNCDLHLCRTHMHEQLSRYQSNPSVGLSYHFLATPYLSLSSWSWFPPAPSISSATLGFPWICRCFVWIDSSGRRPRHGVSMSYFAVERRLDHDFSQIRRQSRFEEINRSKCKLWLQAGTGSQIEHILRSIPCKYPRQLYKWFFLYKRQFELDDRGW